ncbi:MAG: helix-hairpin-helix domain-containing protein [Fuerstiella sp.]
MSDPVDKLNLTRAPGDQVDEARQSLASYFVVTCLCFGLVAMTMTWWRQNQQSIGPQNSGQQSGGQQAKLASDSIDINAADWTSFSQLPGIGPTLGFRIVADRKHLGPFKNIDDLQRVEGIGPLTLDRIRYRLTIGHDQLKSSVQQRQPK